MQSGPISLLQQEGLQTWQIHSELPLPGHTLLLTALKKFSLCDYFCQFFETL